MPASCSPRTLPGTYQSLEVARRWAGIAFENLPLGSIMQASRCDNFLPTSFFSCTVKFSPKKKKRQVTPRLAKRESLVPVPKADVAGIFFLLA